MAERRSLIYVTFADSWPTSRGCRSPEQNEVPAPVRALFVDGVAATKIGMLISDDPQPAAQYLLYIRTLEKLNPQFNWRHIITALHWALYGDKDDASLLFAEGPENSGWNGDWGANAAPGVDLGWKSSTRQEKLLGTPRVMVLKDGRRVDMAHVYAGLRGGLNRWGPNRWVFERVNTTWGDNAQVAFHFVMDLDTGSSARWKPPQQALGNSLALVLGRILRDNPAMQLSEALEQAVGTI